MVKGERGGSAVGDGLDDRGLEPSAVSRLATGTTQGDVLVPGFASMVHGRLGGGPMELLSAAGVCASGMAALKGAVSAVRLGGHPVAGAGGLGPGTPSARVRAAATLGPTVLGWAPSV